MNRRNGRMDRGVSRKNSKRVSVRSDRREGGSVIKCRGKVLTLFIAALMCIMLSSFFVSAQQPINSGKDILYKSIVIQPEDTLWGIAEEYMTSDCNSVNEYVGKLVKLNGLASDSIQSGMSLIVAYEPI